MGWLLLDVNFGTDCFYDYRWAAKEAAIKAHTLRRITMHDITIYRGEQKEGRSKAPTMTIKSKAGGEEQVAKISISHDGEYATAVCLIAEEEEESVANLPSEDTDRPAGEADAPSPTNSTAPIREECRSVNFFNFLENTDRTLPTTLDSSSLII
jgi:hypothetical protein